MRAHEELPGEKGGSKGRIPHPAAPAPRDPARGPTNPAEVMALQRWVGNRAVSRLLTEDPHVHGADCGHDGVEDTSPTGQRALLDAAMASPASPLPGSLRAKAESFYRNDFSPTLLHDGPLAQRAIKAMGAQAMTVGTHIFLPPGGAQNMALVGHELSHADKNLRGERETGTDNGAGVTVTDPRQDSEQTADTEGTAFAQGVRTAPSVVAQRAVTEEADQMASGGPHGASSAPVQRVVIPGNEDPVEPRTVYETRDQLEPQDHTHDHVNAVPAEPPTVQRTGGAGSAAGPSTDPAQTPTRGLQNFLDNWMKTSSVPVVGRSNALKAIDESVQEWLGSGYTMQGNLDVNEAELTAVLTAIDGWRRTKTGGSRRDKAVTELDTKVRAALADIDDRRRGREEQDRLRGKYSAIDPRIEGYARRSNVQEVTVDPVNNKMHQALTGHDDQGQLTERSLAILDQLASERLDKQLKIARQGQVTAEGVTDDQIRELMGRNPNERTRKPRFPELDSYLANRGAESDTDAADPADQEKVTRKVGDTQVTVYWDSTDALREKRIGMLEEAIRKVQEAGYPMPNLTVYLPKYGRQLTVTPNEITETGTRRAQRAEFIAPDSIATSPEGVGNPLTEKIGQDYYYLSTQLAPEGTGTIVHELGHFLHYQQSRGRFHDLNFTQFAQGKDAVAHSVSGYATKDPREFVAEVFLGRMYGKEFSDAVMEMYEALGGPEPSAAATAASA
ncbi:eCIS core domain-containing protein [Streptomyces sp. 2A115]|uniref:eCIS core domain-containing protein n=1 Tax=Streptomyces sp. 2A115 TaxID=3457439 RepID=UPI003FD114B6